MKVILKQTMTRLGSIGDTVEVKDGYARNYLIPQDIVIPVLKTKRSQQEVAAFLKNINTHKQEEEKLHSDILGLKETLSSIEIQERATVEGILFRRINEKLIAQFIKEQTSVAVPIKNIRMSPIKSIGEYNITIDLSKDNKIQLQLIITQQQ